MLLAKIFWRRYRCAECDHFFELPLDDTTLPPHARTRDGSDPCTGCDAVPA
jgi:hypothetical protein